jgi:hypothetical protein
MLVGGRLGKLEISAVGQDYPLLPHFGSKSAICIAKFASRAGETGKIVAEFAMLTDGRLAQLETSAASRHRQSPLLLPFQAISTGSGIRFEMKTESVDKIRLCQRSSSGGVPHSLVFSSYPI